MKTIISLIVLFISFTGFSQQDQHTSFSYKAPTLYNPAAPIIGAGRFSLSTGMRMQWLPVSDHGMRTNTALFLAQVGEKMRNGYFTIGAHFYNDLSGNKTITTNSIAVPISYTIKMDRNSKLSIGLAPQYSSRSLQANGTWGNQWNGTAYDQSILNGETFNDQSSGYFDMQAGIFFQTVIDRKRRLFMGASIDHIAKPRYSLLTYSTDELNHRYTVHGGMLVHGNSRKFSYQPTFYGSWQAGNYNLMGGVEFIYHAKERSRSLNREEGIDVNFAVFYRYADAGIFQLSYRNAGFEVGMSYDMNISRLTRASKSFGAAEVFLRLNFGKNANQFEFRI